jgi:hypothetical protein
VRTIHYICRLDQIALDFIVANSELARKGFLNRVWGLLVQLFVSVRWRGEKSKKCPLALASDLKNYTKVTVPTSATEGIGGLDNVTLQKLKHSPSVATRPSL